MGLFIGAMDLFLTESTKKYLNDKNMEVWYWLSSRDAKAEIIAKYRSERMLYLIFVYSGGLTLCVSAFIKISYMRPFEDFLVNIVAAGFSVVFARVIWEIQPMRRLSRRFYFYCLTGDSLLLIFSKCLLVQLPLFLLPLAVIWVFHYLPPTPFVTTSFLIIYVILLFAILPVLGSIASASSLSVDILFAMLIGTTYVALEVFVRKVIETNKGLVVGLSAVLIELSHQLKDIF